MSNYTGQPIDLEQIVELIGRPDQILQYVNPSRPDVPTGTTEIRWKCGCRAVPAGPTKRTWRPRCSRHDKLDVF